jgi:hypothetical protein
VLGTSVTPTASLSSAAPGPKRGSRSTSLSAWRPSSQATLPDERRMNVDGAAKSSETGISKDR